jgi:hypothetical protein
VKPVVETADTSDTAVVFESEMTTTGVAEYAEPNVMVHELALVPVVNDPTSSLAFTPIAGDPVPQDDIVGVAPVLEAMM